MQTNSHSLGSSIHPAQTNSGRLTPLHFKRCVFEVPSAARHPVEGTQLEARQLWLISLLNSRCASEPVVLFEYQSPHLKSGRDGSSSGVV